MRLAKFLRIRITRGPAALEPMQRLSEAPGAKSQQVATEPVTQPET